MISFHSVQIAADRRVDAEREETLPQLRLDPTDFRARPTHPSTRAHPFPHRNFKEIEL